MASHDQSTMTERSLYSHGRFGLTIKDGLQFISALLLPLMLGVFTIVITIEQQRVSKEQREQDLAELRLQREQDLNNSMLQRALDRQIAKEQREQDERRRLQDLSISESKRLQDDELAAKQRDLLEKQRAHELAIETQRHQDTLLVAYMNEVGALIEKNNGSLGANPLIATLVRVKTLTLARQIDSTRNTQVVQFLYESGQLTKGHQPLDIRGAEFSGINLSAAAYPLSMRGLHLVGARLSNASFENRDLMDADFSAAFLDGVSFARTDLHRVDFSRTLLLKTDFTGALITESIFNHANMVRVQAPTTTFHNCQFVGVSLRQIQVTPRTRFEYCNFTDIVDLYNMNFNSMEFRKSYFKNVHIRDSIFTNANLDYTQFIDVISTRNDFTRFNGEGTQFIKVRLNDTIFVHSKLRKSVWIESHIYNSSFAGANLIEADFHDTRIENVSFNETIATKTIFSKVSLKGSHFCRCSCDRIKFDARSSMRDVSFQAAMLISSNFSRVESIINVDFTGVIGNDADFSRVNLEEHNFQGSQLARANFAWSVCDSANFMNADLSDAEMSHASLHFTNITQEQLDKAMSVSSTFFQRRHLRNPNLLVESLANCSDSINALNKSIWTIEPRRTHINVIHPHNRSCYLAAISNTSQLVTVSQLLNITRYQRLINEALARVYVAIDVWNSSILVYLTVFGAIYSPFNHTFGESFMCSIVSVDRLRRGHSLLHV